MGVLAAFVALYAKYMVVKVLTVLGFSYLTYVGIDALHAGLESAIIGQYNALQPDIYAMLTLAGVDVFIKTIITGYAMFWQIKAVNGALKALKLTG
jgi:threonine/homoserine/homoserine lactone efflux protein